MKKYAITAIAGILLLMNAQFCHGLDVGDAAKDFALKDASGAVVTLRPLMRGADATVLEFLSIYCDACQKKVPRLNGLARKYGPSRLRIIAIALANEQPEVAAAMNQWGVTYSFLADPEKITFYLYGIHKVPRFFILDRDGIIKYSGNADDFSDFEKTIENLLAQTTVRKPLQPGDDAPSLKLTDDLGKTLELDFAGRQHMTVLGFFTAPDSANTKLAALLSQVNDKHQSAGIRVCGIAAGSLKGDMAAFKKAAAPAFPLLADTSDAAAVRYGIGAEPEIVLIGATGHVTARNAPRTYDELVKLLAVTKPETSAASAEQQIAQSLKLAMPDARSIDPVRLPEATIYVGTDAKGKKTYARLVKKDILCEVCTDVEFIETLDPNGKYRSLVLVRPFEVYGKQVDTKNFLQQFIGRSYHQKVVAGSNADIISGATKSSLKLIEGLNETEKIFADFLADPSFDSTFRQSVCFQAQTELELALHLYLREHAKAAKDISINDLSPYCPEGKMPLCPSSGTYRTTMLNGILRVMCTVHGADPQSSIIH